MPKRSKVPSKAKVNQGNDEELVDVVGKLRHCAKCQEKHAPPTGRGCTRGSHDTSAEFDVGAEEIPQLKQMMAMQLKLMQTMADNFPGKKQFKKRKCHTPVEEPNSSCSESDGDSGSADESADSTEDDITPPSRLKSHSSLAIKRKARRSGLLPQKGMRAHVDSGRDRAVTKTKRFGLVWPHERLRRKQGKPVAYDELTFQDFVLGYTMISEEQSTGIRQAMIRHLQGLCRDVTKHGWEATRDFHGIVLNEIELGHLTWPEHEVIQQLRAEELWTFKPKEKESKQYVAKPCFAFNDGKCKHAGDHPGDKGGFYKHMCAFCAKSGHCNRHTELECTKKANAMSKASMEEKSTKNE